MAVFNYQKKLRRAKAIERGLKMVPILIHLPPPSSDTQSGQRDLREVMREKTSQAEVLYNLIAGTATEGFKSNFYGQRHIAFELIAIEGIVHFYAAVPVALVSVVKKAIQTAYPGARMEEAEDHNIFNQEGRLAATMGGEMVLRADSAYPIATYEQLERDPMEALLTTIAALEKKDGVAVQIMLRPAKPDWVKRSIKVADDLRKGRNSSLKFTPMDLAKAALKAPGERRDEEKAKNGGAPDVSNLQLSQVEKIEEKTKHPGFEILIRVIVSTSSVVRSQQLLRDISTAFALFENPGLNGFKFLPAIDVQGMVTAFIFRFFPPELRSDVLSSAELATLFHLPDSQFTPNASVARQTSKQVDGPVQLSNVGLLFGYNEFRGVKKEIRLSPEDRRRHTYILGQTGTGKSTMLENLAVQDMVAGNGFAFIDPHGDSAEKLLALVPKERAEDVIYFNPADAQYPLGLNLFEFNEPAQKDFLVQETINMLYKLYDPGRTGIIGPRYEHWYRNAALTLMSDPNGSTFIEIPKVFTDTDYLKKKFKYLKDPTVIDFWTKEMGQTSDYHKSEMLGWFVSKFGAFQNNEMMRNIIGQTKSSFNIREVMDQKKILIVNLSKGRIGELNSQLLGMIFVIKFQAAAMSRADVPEEQRSDFALYVDEFQNFSTDSFASILSEARKYRLNLIVANQFIGQLSNEIRDAVFGNIGTIVAHRMGPEDAEFMTKQFAPVFDAGDLVNIPNYQAAMRLMIGGLPSQPFSISDSAPLGNANAELGLAIKQLSAAKYGHEKAVVEADIFERMSGHAGPVAPPVMPVPGAAPAQAPVAAVPAAAMPGPAAVSSVPAASAIPGMATPPLMAPVAPAPGLPMMPAPTVDVTVTPPPIGAPPIGSVPVKPVAQPVSAVQAPVADQSRPAMVPGQIMESTLAAPPPIGAPPIGAPPMTMPELAIPEAVLKPSTPGTLSLADITGGRQSVRRSQPASSLDDIPLLVGGSESALVPEVGDGRPDPTDPYAGIDILAESPVVAAPQAPEPETVGRPLPDDPYGQIDVLGGGEAAPSMVQPAGEATPLAPSALMDDVAELSEPVRNERPEPIVQLTEPIATRSEPEPRLPLKPEPVMEAAPVPVVTMPEPLVAVPAPPEVSPPQHNLTEEEWAGSGVVDREGQDFELSDDISSDPLIHFVDPAAEALLRAPVRANATDTDQMTGDQPSLQGLPEGVALIDPTAPVPKPAPPVVPLPSVASNAVPAAQVALAEQLSRGISEPAAVPSIPAASPAEPVLAPELEDVVAPGEGMDLRALSAEADRVAAAPQSEPVAPAAEAQKPEAAPVAVPVSELVATKAESAPVPPPESVPMAPSVSEKAPAEPVSNEVFVRPQPSLAVPVPQPVEIVEPGPAPVVEAPVAVPASEPVSAPMPERVPEAVSLSPVAPEPAVVLERVTAPEQNPPPAESEPPAAPQADISQQIQQAEHKIDDLLSVSLIHSDSTPTHRRLPEPVVQKESTEDGGVDLELNGSGSRVADVATKDGRSAIVHHGLKVIQPLEPIVSVKERFAKELAEMEKTPDPAQTPPVAKPEDHKPPMPVAKLPEPVKSIEPEKPAEQEKAVQESVAQEKSETPLNEPTPVAVTPAIQAAAPQPTFDDTELPQAESLEAHDVAQARVEQHAAVAAATEQSQAQPAMENIQAPAQDRQEEGSHENARSSELGEQEVVKERRDSLPKIIKRHRRRGGDRLEERPAEQIASPEEAEHNQPSAAAVEAAPLTGKLILPSGDRPKAEVEEVKAEKPKKLAPGEVYVDESGNVMIG